MGETLSKGHATNHYEEYYNYYLITIIISNIAVINTIIITVIIITERLGGISLKAGYIYLFDLQFDQDALFAFFFVTFHLMLVFWICRVGHKFERISNKHF